MELISEILYTPFPLIRLFLAIGGVVVTLVWNFPYKTISIFDRLKLHNTRTLIYSLIQVVLFYPQIFGVRFLPFQESGYTTLFCVCGVVFFYVGLLLSVWARITMGKAWGLPGSWDTKRERKLITTGPYRYSRNPIYLGIICMVVGFEVALNSYLFLLAIGFYIYFLWEIKKEEDILTRVFGNEFKKYKNGVPAII